MTSDFEKPKNSSADSSSSTEANLSDGTEKTVTTSSVPSTSTAKTDEEPSKTLEQQHSHSDLGTSSSPRTLHTDVDVESETETEKDSMSAAGWILIFLLVLLTGAGLALYFFPKIQPYVPARIAQYITPVDNVNSNNITLEQDVIQLREEVQSIKDNLKSVETTVGTLETTAQQQSVLPLEDGKTALPADLTAMEKQLATLEDQIVALQISTQATENRQLNGTTSTVIDTSNNSDDATPSVQKLVDAVAETNAPATPTSTPSLSSEDGTPLMRQSLDAVISKMAALEKQVNLQAQTLKSTPSGDTVEQIRAQLATLEKETQSLDEKTTERTPRLEDLGERIKSVEESLRKRFQVQETVGLGVAVSNLIEASERMSPFGDQLATIESMTGITPPEQLQAYAAQGVPSLLILTSRFEEVELKTLRVAERTGSANAVPPGQSTTASVWGKVKNWTNSLVTVRPRNVQTGTTPQAYLSQAQSRLNTGDLKRAVEALESLPQDIKDTALLSEWMQDARARLEVESLIKGYRHALLQNSEAGE